MKSSERSERNRYFLLSAGSSPNRILSTIPAACTAPLSASCVDNGGFIEWHTRLSECVSTLNLGIDVQQFQDKQSEQEAARQDADEIKQSIAALSAQSSNQHSSMKFHVDNKIEQKFESLYRHLDEIKINTNISSVPPPNYSSAGSGSVSGSVSGSGSGPSRSSLPSSPRSPSS
jgi:hypothetical protein